MSTKDSALQKVHHHAADSRKAERGGPMAAKGSAFQKMHLDEIAERARLFQRLARTKEYAKKRIIQNLRWEFESSSSTALEKKVDEIVNCVYSA
jgi:hypothetical protein